MTEADYEYECSRAELLGLPKPSREDFFSQREFPREEGSEEELTTKQAEDEDIRREGLSRIGGGLDELNSILSSTQKKLNHFKNFCGSFTNLLKIASKKEGGNENQEPSMENSEKELKCSKLQEKNGDAELDKLDSLINKAEKAELSLSSQNKQMKKFLN